MRILEELDLIKHEASSIILGVAIIEDIIVISILAILQSVGSTGHVSSSSSSSLLIPNLAVSVGTVLAFIAGVLILGSKTIPRFVNYIGKTNQHDLLIVAVLGVAFGLSFIAQEIGISVATGAFFAGVLIAESKVHSVTKVLATPLKDMFAAIFFVSVGALMDISVLPMFIVPALILIIVSIAAKFLTVVIASRHRRLAY
jgi:CPA2 family monovalent cation:H+ antiporter-2